jgi:pimeloyl-ACP methyl ester carboxylesterase
MMAIQNPVILIPGITATELFDDYPLKTEEVWTMMLNKEYERIALHPDDLRYEAIEPAHVLPGRAFSIYNDLIKALRHELSFHADKPTPVFAFPYDWRVDVQITAKMLGEYLKEVIARTKLLKHYSKAHDLRVDLVGHSMGGLMLCEYLSQANSKSLVGRVATIGTPFLGSIEAIVKIATGMSLLSGDEPRERERESARVTPSLYQLFPSYKKAAVTKEGKTVDLYDPTNMQGSVLESLTEFVRLYSVDTLSSDRKVRAKRILKDLLARGRAHRATVMNFKPARAGLKQKDWLAIVGVGQRTRIQLTVDWARGKPRFVIDDNQFVNDLTSGSPRSRRTGDGTVPLAGAIAPFLPENQLVCVTKKDLGFLELRDRLLVALGGFHGILPKVNIVQRLVLRHLRPTYRGTVWGRRLPGTNTWNPPIKGLQEKTY